MRTWLPTSRAAVRLAPATLKPWLLDRRSLTEKLRRASGGTFHLRVVARLRAKPDHSERDALRLAPHLVALVREVILHGHDTPWVFARSVLPLQTLTGPYRHLRTLNNRPLGEILHRDQRIVRGDTEIGRFPPNWKRLPDVVRPIHQMVWGRRAVYHLPTGPLLVSEMFLPDIDNSPWS